MGARVRYRIILSMTMIWVLLFIVPSAVAKTGGESKNRCVGGEPSAPVKIEGTVSYPVLKDYIDGLLKERR